MRTPDLAHLLEARTNLVSVTQSDGRVERGGE